MSNFDTFTANEALAMIEDVIATCNSGAESTLKVGVYFNIFPNFLATSESGGVTKSRPIDPFLDVIYLFFNVRFGQKVFKLGHFWMSSSTF